MTTNDLKATLNHYASDPQLASSIEAGCLWQARDSVLAFLSAPLPCLHCGFVGRGHVHLLAPKILADFIVKYPRNP